MPNDRECISLSVRRFSNEIIRRANDLQEKAGRVPIRRASNTDEVGEPLDREHVSAVLARPVSVGQGEVQGGRKEEGRRKDDVDCEEPQHDGGTDAYSARLTLGPEFSRKHHGLYSSRPPLTSPLPYPRQVWLCRSIFSSMYSIDGCRTSSLFPLILIFLYGLRLVFVYSTVLTLSWFGNSELHGAVECGFGSKKYRSRGL